MSKGYSRICVFLAISLSIIFHTLKNNLFFETIRKRWNLFENRYCRKLFFEWLLFTISTMELNAASIFLFCCWQKRFIALLELARLWGWYREMYRKRWTVKTLRMDLWYGGNGSGWCAKILAKIICIFFFSILLHGKPIHNLYIQRLRDKEGFPSYPLSSSSNRSCNFVTLKTYCRGRDYSHYIQRAVRPQNFLRQKKAKIFFSFSIFKFFKN